MFEDAAIEVVDKPAGMVVNNAQTVKEETVQSWFANKVDLGKGTGEFWEKGGVVHRLDKDTNGVMVLAKTPDAYEKIKQQFMERTTLKKYVALVHGKMNEDNGLITATIQRHPKDSRKFTVGGEIDRSAITEWKVIQTLTKDGDDYSLLELTPHTGRTHQLRVHLQSIHHPIVSDSIYGYRKKLKGDLSWCPRLFLHAKYLEFTHPVSGNRVHFEAQLPEVLQNLLH